MSETDYCELRLFVTRDGLNDNDYTELVNSYKNHCEEHNNKILLSKYKDAGFDVLVAKNQTFMEIHSKGSLIDLNIRCSMYCTEHRFIPPNVHRQVVTPQSYFLSPRSSTGTKTPLRLANSMGIIDSGYRGNIKACVDCNNYTIDVSTNNQLRVDGFNGFTIKKTNRYFQICSPNLKPILVKLVTTEEDLNNDETTTERGIDGFGSTG